jgi:hypothetical protein
MGYGGQRITFVGHGIGLDLDEYPFLAKGQKITLEEGMAVALEPKLVFPKKGGGGNRKHPCGYYRRFACPHHLRGRHLHPLMHTGAQ